MAVDHAQALAWYRKERRGGEADGQYWLGRYVSGFGGVARPDPTETVRWFRRAADDGHEEARLNLGEIYLGGFGEVKPQPAEALRFLRLAATATDASIAARAQLQLGVCHEMGIGTAVSAATALGHYERSVPPATPRPRPGSACCS